MGEETTERKKRRGNTKETNSDAFAEDDNENSCDEENHDANQAAEDEETASRIQHLKLKENESKEDGNDESKSSVRVVEDGAFTISSTIIHSNSSKEVDANTDQD